MKIRMKFFTPSTRLSVMFQCYIQLLQSQKVKKKKTQQEKPVEEESDVVDEGRKM